MWFFCNVFRKKLRIFNHNNAYHCRQTVDSLEICSKHYFLHYPLFLFIFLKLAQFTHLYRCDGKLRTSAHSLVENVTVTTLCRMHCEEGARRLNV